MVSGIEFEDWRRVARRCGDTTARCTGLEMGEVLVSVMAPNGRTAAERIGGKRKGKGLSIPSSTRAAFRFPGLMDGGQAVVLGMSGPLEGEQPNVSGLKV